MVEICDCIDAGVWTGLFAGDTVDISMEILVGDSAETATSGDNGVYWAEDIDSIALATYPDPEGTDEFLNGFGCDDNVCTPDQGKGFKGLWTYSPTGDIPLEGPDTRCTIDMDEDGDADSLDRHRVYKFRASSSQDPGTHGYVVTTDDADNSKDHWWIDIPWMRVDPIKVDSGDTVWVEICLTPGGSGGGVCGSCEGCCFKVKIGKLCCPEVDPDYYCLYPYFPQLNDEDWWSGMTIVNQTGTAGTATIYYYENDGDTASLDVTVGAHRIVTVTWLDMLAGLELDQEGTLGDNPFYLKVVADFLAQGFAMMGEKDGGKTQGYIPICCGFCPCD